MSDSEAPNETTEVIMQATYRALCKHGYPATTISKIAEEFPKSQSLLYYHYEDKEDLLEDFLRYLLDEYESELADADDEDPYDRLVAVIDSLLPPEIADEQLRFRRALLEIRSQAPYHEVYHDRLVQSDELIRAELVAAIERGIETGDFRAVNSELVAEFLYSAADGAVSRAVSLDDPDVIRRNREIVLDYIDSQLRRYV